MLQTATTHLKMSEKWRCKMMMMNDDVLSEKLPILAAPFLIAHYTVNPWKTWYKPDILRNYRLQFIGNVCGIQFSVENYQLAMQPIKTYTVLMLGFLVIAEFLVYILRV